MEDTIAAISTTLGVGAIAIIRVSGSEAIEITNKIFDRDLKKVNSHTINYGHIIDNNKIIDEVLVSVMKAPNTFTKEDVVEINTHGGIATTNKVLELLLLNGCRLSEPGEFTKRAFLNGRIDLLEAEGVMDVINSKTEKSLDIALSQLNGEGSKLIEELRQKIVNILANIEVNIDYPEYEDIEEITIKDISNCLDDIKKEIENIIMTSKDASIIKDGIKTVIVGKPNVGKSSILNKLLQEEKAIVTDIPGTTRDIVEGEIYIDGINLKIIDTAGIRKTNDIVESIGVEKSIKLIDDCDLVLFVLNNNEKITNEEQELLSKIKNKNHIVIVNKIDLEKKLLINNDNIIYVSTIENRGIKEIKEKIKEMFNFESFNTQDMTYISSARSISLLKECLKLIEQIKISIANNDPIDMVEIDLKDIWNKLGEIIGKTYQEELIDQLFSQFCLGK